MPTSDRKIIQGYIKSLKGDLAATDHLVQLHVDDIKMIMGLFQALATRISRLEDQLGETEPVVMPGD